MSFSITSEVFDKISHYDYFVCILVVKKSNVIQLHVDAASEHGVGPKQHVSNGGKETVYLGSVPGMTPGAVKSANVITCTLCPQTKMK